MDRRGIYGALLLVAAAAIFMALQVQERNTQIRELRTQNQELRLAVNNLKEERDHLARKLDAVIAEIPPRPSAPSEEMELGIIESREAFPNVTEGMRVQNRWQGKVADNYAIVFAGAEAENSAQGLLLYVNYKKGSAVPGPARRFPTPVREGPVKVVREEANRLILSTQTGLELVFDLASLEFVE